MRILLLWISDAGVKPAARIWVPAGFGLDRARPWNPTALDRIVRHGKSAKGSSLLVGKTL